MTAGGLLLFARCAGFAARAPGISYPGVPPMLRVGIALCLALALLPNAHARALANGAALVAGVALEFLIGSAIGIGASVLYDGAYAGGRAIDDYVGVKAIAPSVHLVAPSGFGRIWSLAFTGAFFLLGAYRPVIFAFSASLSQLPLGTLPSAHAWAAYAASVAVTLLRVALAVAAPAIAAAFLVQLALGALSRTIPRFASTTLAFPLTFGSALVACVLCIPAIVLVGEPIVPFP
ncbi:MAG: flagellar biosynthetic protein FliR [Candidatus Tyrphobacter sp.]